MGRFREPIIIADSSPLIALALVELIPELVAMAQKVWIPETVYRECTHNSVLPGARAVSFAVKTGLITITPDKTLSDNNQLQTIARCIDAGEAQAIAAALEQTCLLLMDDKAGRRCAATLNIPVIGSLGVLIRLKKRGKIASIKPSLKILKQHGYWYHPALIDKAMEKAGEKNTF